MKLPLFIERTLKVGDLSPFILLQAGNWSTPNGIELLGIDGAVVNSFPAPTVVRARSLVRTDKPVTVYTYS